MKQRYIHLVLVLSAICIHMHVAHAQSNYTFHSKNVAVIGYDKFSRANGSDVWGIKIAGTPDKHYALSTLGGGLSIALVNGTSPAYYNEVAYVNHDDYDIQAQTPISHGFADVETFVVSGITYAALAIASSSANPVVYIVNVDSAIALGVSAQDYFVPISSVQTATIPSLDSGSTQAHTITIAEHILYVATQKHEIDVWDVSNPSSPQHKGSYTLPGGFGSTSHTNESVHEMYADANRLNGHRAYVAYTRGGLFIIDIDTANVANSLIFKRQMYDSDKSSALNVFSTLTPRFDWRNCHSAWPTDDRNYVFTTDEISPGNLERSAFSDLILNLLIS